MALWKLEPADDDLVVLRYLDAKHGIDHECGRTYRTVSLREILSDFVLNHADNFDVISTFEGGKQYALLPGHKVPV